MNTLLSLLFIFAFIGMVIAMCTEFAEVTGQMDTADTCFWLVIGCIVICLVILLTLVVCALAGVPA